MNKQEIGQKLRQLREAKSYNAKDVTELLKEQFEINIQYKSIYNYENGRNFPDIDIFLAMCKLYDCKDVLYEFGYSNRKVLSDNNQEDSLILEIYHKLTPESKELIRGALGINSKTLKKDLEKLA